jgi:hypothetical protein
MAPRLAQVIYQTAAHFEFHRVLVVAGYRAPRIAKEKGNPKSPHKQGVACDFRVDGVANTELRDYLRTVPRVGVGYYPNSEFVHLDVNRKVSAFWIDYSGPGERAKYSANPQADLQKEQIPAAIAPDSTDEPEGGSEPQGASAQGGIAPNAPALMPASP